MTRSVPVWVVNRVRDLDRAAAMRKQFEDLGVTAEFIEAVDGAALSADHLSEYSREGAVKWFGRELSLGEIGCALSHLKLWRRMVEEDVTEALILEDDVRISRGLLAVVRERAALPEDFELVNFLTTTRQEPFGPFVETIYRAARHSGFASGACCYLLTSGGARKLLAVATPIVMPADEITGRTDRSGVVSYGVYPPVAVLSPVGSTIWGIAPRPVYTFLRRRLFFLRQIWYMTLGFFGTHEIGKRLKRLVVRER